jgi:hypothetical protein
VGHMHLRGQSQKLLLRRSASEQRIVLKCGLPSSCVPPGAEVVRGISARCPTLRGCEAQNSHAEEQSRHAKLMAKPPQRDATKWTQGRHALAQPPTRPTTQRPQINACIRLLNTKLWTLLWKYPLPDFVRSFAKYGIA